MSCWTPAIFGRLVGPRSDLDRINGNPANTSRYIDRIHSIFQQISSESVIGPLFFFFFFLWITNVYCSPFRNRFFIFSFHTRSMPVQADFQRGRNRPYWWGWNLENRRLGTWLAAHEWPSKSNRFISLKMLWAPQKQFWRESMDASSTTLRRMMQGRNEELRIHSPACTAWSLNGTNLSR